MRTSPEDPDEGALLYRLEECDLSMEDAARVAEIATPLAETEGLRSRDRQRNRQPIEAAVEGAAGWICKSNCVATARKQAPIASGHRITDSLPDRLDHGSGARRG